MRWQQKHVRIGITIVFVFLLMIQIMFWYRLGSDPIIGAEIKETHNSIFLSAHERRLFQETMDRLESFLKSKNNIPSHLFFIHLAKTGGTSLRDELTTTVGPFRFKAFWYAPDKETAMKTIAPLDNIRNTNESAIIGGHLVWGFHKWVHPPVENPLYFTVLREPVDRTISHYKYHQDPRDPNHNLAMNRTLSEWTRDISYGSNVMTIYLSGIWYSAWWNENDWKLLPKSKYNADMDVTVDDYLRAREHLLKSLVGIQEDFTNSSIMFGKYLDIPLKGTKTSNKGTTGRNIIPTDDDIKVIKEMNRYDIELYELGVYMYQQQLKLLEKYNIVIN